MIILGLYFANAMCFVVEYVPGLCRHPHTQSPLPRGLHHNQRHNCADHVAGNTEARCLQSQWDQCFCCVIIKDRWLVDC